MSIIEDAKPAGLEEWQQRVGELVEKHPDALRKVKVLNGEGYNVVFMEQKPDQSWRTEDDFLNSPYKQKANLEGPRDEEDVAGRGPELARDRVAEEASRVHIESEPSLSVEQVQDVEKRIGAGLIEEVIEVAEGEKRCVEVMWEGKV